MRVVTTPFKGVRIDYPFARISGPQPSSWQSVKGARGGSTQVCARVCVRGCARDEDDDDDVWVKVRDPPEAARHKERTDDHGATDRRQQHSMIYNSRNIVTAAAVYY